MNIKTLILISTLGLFTSSSYAASPEVPRPEPKVHPHQERCVACHVSGVDITQVFAEAGNDCLQCHDPDSINANLRKVLQSESSTSAPKDQKITQGIGMSLPMYYDESRLGDTPNEMILIPGGEFIMGTDGRLPDEGPRHTAKVSTYHIDLYEVTNLQYKKFNDATQGKSPDHFRNRTYPKGKADHPVTYVTWVDANAYCEWAGKRLPSDVEWEKAARGTDERMFPWGEEFSIENANTPVRWQNLGLFGDTTPVGAFQKGKSFYGLHDTSGNVWEWTASWYKAYPGNTHESESYGERYKTLKGGSWFDCSFYQCGISAPTFNRAFFAPKTKNDSFGFRCAKDATENTL